MTVPSAVVEQSRDVELQLGDLALIGQRSSWRVVRPTWEPTAIRPCLVACRVSSVSVGCSRDLPQSLADLLVGWRASRTSTDE